MDELAHAPQFADKEFDYVYFKNQDILHIRPSGNADELRFYVFSGSSRRIDEVIDRFVPECIESIFG